MEFYKFLAFAKDVDSAQPNAAKPARWDWAEIVDYAKKREVLKYVDELYFTTVVEWDVHHFLNWLSTISYVKNLIEMGHPEFNKFKLIVSDSFANKTQVLFCSYRLIIFSK